MTREAIYRAALERVAVLQREMFGECLTRPCVDDCILGVVTVASEAGDKAPGLADDAELRRLLGTFLSDCGPTLTHQVEAALRAIEHYQANAGGTL